MGISKNRHAGARTSTHKCPHFGSRPKGPQRCAPPIAGPMTAATTRAQGSRPLCATQLQGIDRCARRYHRARDRCDDPRTGSITAVRAHSQGQMTTAAAARIGAGGAARAVCCLTRSPTAPLIYPPTSTHSPSRGDGQRGEFSDPTNSFVWGFQKISTRALAP